MIKLLTELSIRNFAIIDDISVSFNDGLTVLTGETGAGKSIIIDAVQLLTGSRGSIDFVRHGEEKAEIIGQFSLNENVPRIKGTCQQYAIDIEEDTLILERTIMNTGKSICRVNGKIVTLTILREIGQLLVHIHSQHDTMHLMDPTTHLPLLDAYNEKDIAPIKDEYQKLYDELITLQKKRNQLSSNEQQLAHRLDLLRFQLSELEQANLSIDEDLQLEEERKHLQNYEKIYRSLQEAYFFLTGDQKGLDLVQQAQSALEDGQAHDAFIEKKSEIVANTFYQLEDVSLEINQYMEQLYFDEERLNNVEARMNELNRLMKKYGNTVKEMITYQAKISEEIEQIEHRDSHIEQISEQINRLEKRALKVAQKLHTVRKNTAKHLEEEITVELKDLYLQNANLVVAFHQDEQTELHENGIDHVSFMLSTNLGEPVKELEKIASGGELSRIMLAMKKIFAKHDHIQTVIFDEIDTGVSGRVAQAIGEKMYQIAMSTQTLCITHLPQVAAMADQHMLIQKQEENNRTTTNIYPLDGKEIIHELGKMLTGATLTETAIEHAQELLDLTTTFKRTIRENNIQSC